MRKTNKIQRIKDTSRDKISNRIEQLQVYGSILPKIVLLFETTFYEHDSYPCRKW